jgi:transposase
VSGGKDKLGSISKQGDRYLRSLFTAGALALIRYSKIHGTGHYGPSRQTDAATRL